MTVLVIDNYDSFTYNLVHIIEQFCDEVVVKRNDEIEVKEALRFSHIVLSPGPGLPEDAGIMNKVIRNVTHQKLLGVCLGMQGIAEVFGAKLLNLDRVLHGVTTKCEQIVGASDLYKELPETFTVGHYHSWVVDESSLPERLVATARSADGLLMGLKHTELAIEGVQFHPESVMTPHGTEMLKAWLSA